MRQYGGFERLEASLVDMGLGMSYPPAPDFAPAVLAGLERVKARRPRPLLAPRALTPRAILILLPGLMLLAAAAAAAYYVTTQTWLSAGPRGVQFSSDFELVELFRAEPGAQYSDLAIGAGGDDIYAIRLVSDPLSLEEGPDLAKTAIVRLYGLQAEQLRTEVVLNFGDLKDPALWDPGTDLSGSILPACCSDPKSKLSVTPNGDLFLLASASTGTTFRDAYNRVQATSLIVRHPDGRTQQVLTLRELADASLINAVAIAASASDRLWLLVLTQRPVQAGEHVVRLIYQIQDPNADGDWSDRKVVPLTLPAPVGGEDAPAGETWFLLNLVAEPSLSGEDRSRSFLTLMQSLAGEFRIYRVSDHNADGDALDGDEFKLLFSAVATAPDVNYSLAPRIVISDGKVVLRELVVSSFTTQTRVSRITETGEVTDIARAFNSIEGLVADSRGNLYVLAYPPDNLTSVVLYKLKPVLVGANVEAAAATAQPAPSAVGVVGAGIPTIAFTREVRRTSPGSTTSEKREILLMGADGSGPVKLVAGEHNFLGLRSPGGSRMAYWSDEEVPNEQFVHVANADGSAPKKLTEKPADVFCWPSEDRLILSVPSGGSYTPTIYDLKTGQEVRKLKELRNATAVAWPACTPARHHVAFATGIDLSKRPPTGQERLELLNLDTGERRQLDGPLSDRSYLDLRWTADGRRLGYVVGPPRGYKPPPYPDDSYELYVADLQEGKPRLVARTDGTIQWFDWSPSGDWLLLHLASGRLCEGEEARVRGEDFCDVQRGLVLVNAQSGKARQVVSGDYFSARWMPAEDAFAYGTGQAIYLVSVNGDARQVATASEGRCAFCLGESFGFSPDGRYLGLSNFGGGSGDPAMITIVDIGTGETRVLVEEREGISIWNPQWWK